MFSRILGYVRDQRIAFLLGTSVVGDSFVLAFRIPNLVRRLVVEGAFAGAFIPVFAQSLDSGDRPRWRLFVNRVFWNMGLLLALTAVIGYFLSPGIIRAFTFGGAIDRALAISLIKVMWPFVIFVGLSALAVATLNTFQVFALPSLTPVFLNVSIIVFSFLAFRFRNPAMALAVGVVVGGAAQFLVQVPALRKRGVTLAPSVAFNDPDFRKVMRLMAPGVVGIGVAQINFVVNSFFATHPLMPQGSVMSLQIADRIMELVLGGYAVALATALLPTMAQQVVERNIVDLRRTISFSLRLVSFITIPATVGLMVLREPIIQVLFQHGRFDYASTQLTAWALLFSAMGLPWFSGLKVLIPAFYATHDTRTPALAGVAVMVTNALLNLVFIIPLRNGGPALASALAGALNFWLLYALFSRRHGRLADGRVLASLAKICAASAVMGAACQLMLRFSGFGYARGPHTLGFQVIVLAAMLAVGAGLYFAIARWLGCAELNDLLAIVRRRERLLPDTADVG